MSAPTPSTDVACTVVVGPGELAGPAMEELAQVTGAMHRAASPEELVDWAPPPGQWVALVVLLDEDDDVGVDPVVLTLLALPAFAEARLLVVTTRSSLTDMSSSIDSGHIDGVVAAPWTPGNLARYAVAQVSRATLLAGRSAPWESSDSELLRHLSMGTDAAAVELLDALEAVLGPRPRVHLRPGVRITVPEERLNQVFLIISGRVALTVTSAAGEVILHHASTGPLVGLLALTEMQDSTVTARTTTACELVSLTLEQLDFALTRDPRVGTTLMALSMRALSTRLRRSEELHLENATLSAELRSTLEELRAARAGLVEQARLATLGELAAGVAHELNNPAATVTRGVDHLSADLRALLAMEAGAGTGTAAAAGSGAAETGTEKAAKPENDEAVPHRGTRRLGRVRERVQRTIVPARLTRRRDRRRARGQTARADARPETRPDAGQAPAQPAPTPSGQPSRQPGGQDLAGAALRALVAAEERDHVSTREERELRRALGRSVADPVMVRRLVAAGVTDPEQARALVEGPPERLARVENAAAIGAALRAVRVAGHHIATLVSALHAHARPDPAEDEELHEPTDVDRTVQDALRLLEHRLRGLDVDVEVEPGLPQVTSGPGLLTQVWTNLLSNAADVLDRGGRPGQVTVRVSGGRLEQGRPTVVRVEVQDDGPGVPPALREQIFAPRFTTKHGVVRYGLGLGLGIARSIVARHGGRILLDSRPGCTVFTVELPAAGTDPLTPPPPATESGGGQGPVTGRATADEGGPHTPKEAR